MEVCTALQPVPCSMLCWMCWASAHAAAGALCCGCVKVSQRVGVASRDACRLHGGVAWMLATDLHCCTSVAVLRCCVHHTWCVASQDVGLLGRHIGSFSVCVMCVHVLGMQPGSYCFIALSHALATMLATACACSSCRFINPMPQQTAVSFACAYFTALLPGFCCRTPVGELWLGCGACCNYPAQLRVQGSSCCGMTIGT